MSKILKDIIDLAKTIKDTQEDKELMEEDLDFLTNRIENFPRYFNSIITMEIRLEMAKFRLEGAELGEYRANLDANRRSAHISVADSVNQINKLCEIYQKDPIFELPGNKEKLNSADIDDREFAADLVYGFCKEVFLESKLRERYNELEENGDTNRDSELYGMIQSRETFGGKVSVDDLIKLAADDTEKSEGKEEDLDDVCL